MLSGWGLLVWPIVVLALLRIFLMPVFEITHDLVEDWYNHAVSFSAFLLGFLLARREDFWAELSKQRWLALAPGSRPMWPSPATPGSTAPTASSPPTPCATSCGSSTRSQQWAAIAAILGFGRLWLRKDGPVRRYLTDAVFTLYIMHQTIIVVVAHHLAQLGLPLAIEVPTLIGVTFGGCFLTYEIVRRIGFLRPWFGLKTLPKRSKAGDAPAPYREAAPDVA